MPRTLKKPGKAAAKSTRRASPAKAAASATKQQPSSVADLLRTLDHPLKKEIEAVRRLILGVDKSISEAIKWNAPSFRTSDFFATIHLRSKDSLQVVMHTGAKTKATATTGIEIADPSGLMKWLAKDRCLVTLGAGTEFAANQKAFAAIVKDWIRWV